jgi:hypothetical protein
MRRSLLTLASLVLASHVAAAQPALTPPPSPAAPSPLPVPAEPISPPSLTPITTPAPTLAPTADAKDPTTAVLLSIGITTAGYVTMIASSNENLQLAGFAATYLGPSTGQWYAGRVGALGLGLRAAGFVSMVYGFGQLLQSECDEIDGPCNTSNSDAIGTAFMLTGAGLWVGSSIYDVVLAKRAADDWNTRHNVNLAPMMTADTSGNKTPGLVLTGRF